MSMAKAKLRVTLQRAVDAVFVPALLLSGPLVVSYLMFRTVGLLEPPPPPGAIFPRKSWGKDGQCPTSNLDLGPPQTTTL